MNTVDNDLIRQVCAILGDDIADDEREAHVLAIADSPMHARRLIDFTREAFGLVLIGHLGKAIVFPTTFMAKAPDGSWAEFSFTNEPVFQAAILVAVEIGHTGPRDLFANIATRGALFIAINKALNEGVDVHGAVLSPPAMLGICAELYQQC